MSRHAPYTRGAPVRWALLASAVLAGCTEPAPNRPLPIAAPVGQVDVEPLSSPPPIEPLPSARSFEQLGTGSFLNADAAAPKAPPSVVENSDGEFTITLVDVPIEQAARAVLGETLNIGFAVAPGTEGNISVQTSRAISASMLFETFETALALSGFFIAERNGILVISRDSAEVPRFRTEAPTSPNADGVYVIPLKYTSATEMADILGPIDTDALDITIDASRNILFVRGRAGAVEPVFDAVNLFDVNAMKGSSVARYAMINAEPSEVAEELTAIFDSGPGGLSEGVVTFIPNAALNSVVVVSKNREYLEEARQLIRSYDRSAASTRRLARAYPLRNRNATELAPVLSELLTFGEVAVDGDGAGGEAAVTADADGEGSARVVADDASNAVIVYATASEHQAIERLIFRLDDVADQVLIEATIAEVTLNDQLNFGVRYFFESGDWAANFTSLGRGAARSIFPGFNAIFDDGDALVAINALAAVTDVNIVSSPSLMVLDNREATLNVGDQVPVATRSAVSTDDANAPIVNNIEQRDTGVILNIKPRVSSSGRVILEIRQEVSDAISTDTSDISSPTIQQRIVSTTVAVDEGQSVVLGGLIREVQTRGQTKIPLLGDIPILGAAFRSTTDVDRRTELLIVIRPRVIRRSSDAANITAEYRAKLSRPNALLSGRPSTPQHTLRRIFY